MATQTETREEELKRVKDCLDYVNQNPGKAPYLWERETIEDARRLGLLPKLAPMIGCNARDDAETTYWENRIMERQEASGMYD